MTHRIDKEYFALDHLTVYMIKTNRVREDSNNFGIKKEISIRERDKTKKEEKKRCLHAGSNYGPPVYKTGALPLSYRGLQAFISNKYQIVIPTGTPITEVDFHF